MNYKKMKVVLIGVLLYYPMIVSAKPYGSEEFSIFFALALEAIVTFYISVFVLYPLAQLFSPDNSKPLFMKLFILRLLILLFFDIFITTYIAIFDLLVIFVGPVIVAILSPIKHKAVDPLELTSQNNSNSDTSSQVNGIELKCAKCSTIVQVADKTCPNCGVALEGDNIVVSENAESAVDIPPKEAAKTSDFDPIYSLTEEQMLEKFITKELEKAGVNKKANLIPEKVLVRKTILNIIFAILLFVYVSLIFFHFPVYTYVLGFIILVVFFIMNQRYSLMKYLKKQIKARPSEKIANIVMNTKSSFVTDNNRSIFALTFAVAIVIPLLIFMNPRIMYEKVEGGYAVRFYTFGLKNYKTATIPETYKGEKVVSLRGNAFSNMFLLKTVSLPNSITEIRGQAFKNCKSLTQVNMPYNLKYLGGGAFYGAKSIKSIELPDSLTYMGGEAFYGATSLEYIRLSNNLSEIRGDTFKYCISLKSIDIPDSVTRIGGHAFYEARSLSEVTFTENSQLREIGSSAFRLCNSLYDITLPSGVSINERSFKESPTRIHSFYGDDEYSYYEYDDYDYDY